MWGRISCPIWQVCDRFHGGLTAKWLTVFLQCKVSFLAHRVILVPCNFVANWGNRGHRASRNQSSSIYEYVANAPSAKLRTEQNEPKFLQHFNASLGNHTMTHYNPQLIHTMRAALDAVMTQVPMIHSTPGLKAPLAEVILQAAAQGLTSYDGLVAAGSDQIQTIIALLS